MSHLGRIRKREVLRYLGYGGQELDAGLDARIDETCALCERTCTPRHVWRAFELGPFEAGRPRTVEGTTLCLPGTSMERYLAGASGVAVLACTLGMASERQLRQLAASDPLGHLVYAAACADLVETEADACEGEIVAWARGEGLTCGSRYSPGYGDLPLDVQPAMLAAVDAGRRLGMCVTDGNLMVPSKSVTALVGLFSGEAAPVALGCIDCRLYEHCELRRRGTPCHRSR